MKALWLSLLFLLDPTAAAAADVPEGPSRTFGARDLFFLEAASDPQISPDGRRIAYVRRSGDIMIDRMRPTIWLVDTSSGEQMPLAAGSGSYGQPRWSPDGSRLAYVATSEGASDQLFVRWLSSGESARITGLPDAPDSIAWSPDGRQIAYTMRVPGESLKLGAPLEKPDGAKWAPPLEIHSAVSYRSDEGGYLKPGFIHVFVVPVDGGAPRQLSFGSVNDYGPLSWTPDGRTILFSSNRTRDWEREGMNTEVHALDVATGDIAVLTHRDGPDDEPTVAPDGRLIAYTGFDDRQMGYQNRLLYVMNRDGSSPRALTGGLDRSVQSPRWAPDGRSIFVMVDDRAARRVIQVDLEGRTRTVAEGLVGTGLDRPYVGGGTFSVARDGSVALSVGQWNRPPDVAIARAGTTKVLTRLNADLLDGKSLGNVRKLEVTSFDNRAIDAWLTLPPAYREGQRVPLILEIHGGPFAAYGPYFSTDNQLYATAGFAVLSTNPRGSTSYGEEFANLIHHAYPGRDYDDLMAAVDAAIAHGFADPERLFVTGGSGGGALTAWIIGKTNRFKAAAAQKPVIAWSSFALTADDPTFFARYWFGKYPWEDPAAFFARSPLSLVGNVKTPTLVVVGSDDYRTPPSEAEQYYTALQIRGVPTALIKVPGASHGGLASRPSQSGAKASAIIAWFRKYESGPPNATAMKQ